jgi:hypothetical protein
MLASCAANQSIEVLSTPNSSSCKLTLNDAEIARVASTPGFAKFKARRGSDVPVIVECQKDDLSAVQVVEALEDGLYPQAVLLNLYPGGRRSGGAAAAHLTSGGNEAQAQALSSAAPPTLSTAPLPALPTAVLPSVANVALQTQPTASQQAAPIAPRAVAQASGNYGNSAELDLGRFHALIIGVDDYQHLTKLKTAVADAKMVANQLRREYAFNIQMLLNPTRDEVMDALDSYIERLDLSDNLLIYYAGHGWRDASTSRGYWLPVDSVQERRTRWISNAEINDTLKALQANHVIIIADSCYAATLTRSAQIGLRDPGYISRIIKKRARVVLTSGGIEPVADDEGDGHSPFAASLVQALGENVGLMDGTQLFVKLRRLVMLKAQQTPEYGDIRGAGHDGGDFIFKRVATQGAG